MAAKFGKREKIVTGLFLGLAAIAIIHIVFFQDKGQRYSNLLAQLNDLNYNLSTISHPPKSDIEAFVTATDNAHGAYQQCDHKESA